MARPWTKWRKFNPCNRNETPSLPGVYVIFIAGGPAYIGSSANICARISSHGFWERGDGVRTPWGWVNATVHGKLKLSERFCDWLTLEARLISRLRPEYNKRIITRDCMDTDPEEEWPAYAQ